MIKVAQERERDEPICIGREIPLENIRRALMELGSRQGLPIDVQVDEVMVGGGLLSFGAPRFPCIVIYNRDHRKNYYCHIFAVEKHFDEYYVQMYLGGNSAVYNSIAMYESRKNRNFLENRLLANARLAYKAEQIYHNRVMELIVPAFRMAMQMPDPQEEEARRRQEEETRRRKAEEEARRRQEEETRRRKAQEEAQRRAAQEKTARSQVREEPRHTEPCVSAGLKEACRGPAQASREYLGGTRETCSTYRYHNGTVTWTKAPVEVVYKNFACRKCGRKFRAKSGSGCHRITCQDCGHRFEIAC